MKFKLLVETYLIESLNSVIKDTKDIPEDIIRQYYSNALPDNNKSDRLLQHVLKMHRNNEITPWDSIKVKQHLSILNNSNNLHRINGNHTLKHLEASTIGLEDKKYTKKENIDKNTSIILNNDNLLIRQHHNHQSAIKGAYLHPQNPMAIHTNEPGKAEWCISADNEDGKEHFNNYSNHGNVPIYTIHNKHTKRTFAYVPNPDNTEIRDEKDVLIHPAHILFQHSDIINTPIGEHILKHNPILHKFLQKYPYNLSSTDIHKILNTSNTQDDSILMHHNNFDNTHVDKIFEKGNIDSIDNLIGYNNINVSTEHLRNAMDIPYINKYNIISHVNADSSILHKAMDDEDEYLRGSAIRHPNADEYLINKGLDDSDINVQIEAAKHKNATEHNLNKAINSENHLVRAAAYTNPSFTKNNLLHALSKSDKEHWSDLAEHPLIDKDVITKALQFEDDGYGYVNDVKSALIRHPLFDKEHIKYLPSYHQSFANKILHEKGKI